jgi:hypothetical protein
MVRCSAMRIAAACTTCQTSPAVRQLNSASASSRVEVVQCSSWDLDLAYVRGGRALCNVEGQQLECVRFRCSVYRPPDLVSARAAGGERVPVAKRALFAFEGGEYDAAFVRAVAVVK